jgi:hypothetical protein
VFATLDNAEITNVSFFLLVCFLEGGDVIK